MIYDDVEAARWARYGGEPAPRLSDAVAELIAGSLLTWERPTVEEHVEAMGLMADGVHVELPPAVLSDAFDHLLTPSRPADPAPLAHAGVRQRATTLPRHLRVARASVTIHSEAVAAWSERRGLARLALAEAA